MQAIKIAVENLVDEELKSFITFLVKKEVISDGSDMENMVLEFKQSKLIKKAIKKKVVSENEADNETSSEEREKKIKKTVKHDKKILNEYEKYKVIDYSDKSIVVIGETKDIKEDLKTKGGRYNSKLSFNDEKVSGWIFKKENLETVNQLLKIS